MTELDEMLVQRILEASVCKTGGVSLFAQEGILSDLELLRLVANLIGQGLPDDTDGVCALATSGVPLGTYLALTLGKPLYFYKGEGLITTENQQIVPLLPSAPKSAKLLLADSHIREGWVVATCLAHLLHNTETEPVGVVSLFDFEGLVQKKYDVDLDRHAVIDIADHLDSLRSILSMATANSVKEHCSIDGAFWGEAIGETDIGQSSRRRRRLPFFIANPWARPKMRIADSPVKPLLDASLDCSDPGIWRFFQDPSLVRKTSLEVANLLPLQEYDTLVGVSVLGTAFALALAFHNALDCSVISFYPEPGLRPVPNSLADRKILMCEVRLLSGLLAAEAYEQVRHHGGTCRTLLAVRLCLDRASSFRRSPMRWLSQEGVEIVALGP